MASRNMLFRAMYRVGFTPWDGHPLAKSLHDLVEGNGYLQDNDPVDVDWRKWARRE